MTQAERAFDDLVASLDYPMFIVTAAGASDRAGCLVGFATQCSIDPAQFVVCLSHRNHTARIAAAAEVLAVHVLRPGDEDIARLFGEETGDDTSKFDRCAWRTGPAGVPVIDSLDWFAGHVRSRDDRGGDHTLYVLDVLSDGRSERSGGQLGYQSLRTLDPGHDP